LIGEEDNKSEGKVPPPSASSSTTPASTVGDSSSERDALKSLSEQFNDPCLKSSTRVLILFSLALNKRLGFVDLLKLTGTGKGSLSNHLEKLESSGYIKQRTQMTFGGSRIVAEITAKGLESYDTLLSSLKKLGR
jgi:DNA-binding MarR family transcriptional regulator